jgi:hypothetical protein
VDIDDIGARWPFGIAESYESMTTVDFGLLLLLLSSLFVLRFFMLVVHREI